MTTPPAGLPDGIRIVPDINVMPGVETLEGRIGPLLNAARGGCHYIEMPPGMYTDEHAHPTESLIYTVRGRWVLCSRGQRFLMNPGSLFWFGDDVPTGYEVPFDEPAFILIFKPGERPSPDEMVEYLKGMAATCAADHDGGAPYWLSELPEDHPARAFAASLR